MSTLRCKPGDLAIITGCLFTPEDLGRIIEVVRPAHDGEVFRGETVALRYNGPSEGTWVVKSTGPRGMVWRNAKGEVYTGFHLAAVSDSHLTPIRPGDLCDDTEETKEREHS